MGQVHIGSGGAGAAVARPVLGPVTAPPPAPIATKPPDIWDTIASIIGAPNADAAYAQIKAVINDPVALQNPGGWLSPALMRALDTAGVDYTYHAPAPVDDDPYGIKALLGSIPEADPSGGSSGGGGGGGGGGGTSAPRPNLSLSRALGYWVDSYGNPLDLPGDPDVPGSSGGGSSGGGGLRTGNGLDPASAAIAAQNRALQQANLQQSQAELEHSHANRLRTITQTLAGRGMINSGDLKYLQGEEDFGYKNQLASITRSLGALANPTGATTAVTAAPTSATPTVTPQTATSTATAAPTVTPPPRYGKDDKGQDIMLY